MQYADKETSAQRSRPVAEQAVSSGRTAGFIDNSAVSTAQRKLAQTIVDSPQAIAQRATISGMHNGAYLVAQRAQIGAMLGRAAQLMPEPEEEELLQGKFSPVQRAQADADSAPPPNNTGLPDNLKSGIESLSGMSMDHVKVHYNSAQPAQLNALAYAQGSDIHVAPGQEQHLPHEAWHVVQQAQGRVQPTMQMNGGVPVNDDHGLENEADVMGARALSTPAGDTGIEA